MKLLELFKSSKSSVQVEAADPIPAEFSSDCAEHVAVFRSVQHATMTSIDRVIALCEAVDYLSEHRIGGDVVECGVWKGGSMMAVAKTLIRNSDENRGLWLFDTYCGMTEPTNFDVDYLGNPADQLLKQSDISESNSIWCRAVLTEVSENLRSTHYDSRKIRFVAGDVQNTLLNPANLPEKIALLRLDTDWYESTKIELEVLFPRLVDGGVLIIDDYGHWQGCRKAVDEYLQKNNVRILLNRIDYTGRIGIKQNSSLGKGLPNVA